MSSRLILAQLFGLAHGSSIFGERRIRHSSEPPSPDKKPKRAGRKTRKVKLKDTPAGKRNRAKTKKVKKPKLWW